jgi:hypothetical protein
LHNKAQAVNDQLKRKVNDSKSQLDARVDIMREQMKNAREKRKARIENQITKVKEEYRLRTEKLKQASKLIGEAVSLKDVSKQTETSEILW